MTNFINFVSVVHENFKFVLHISFIFQLFVPFSNDQLFNEIVCFILK
jgi:hypothetical protein